MKEIQGKLTLVQASERFKLARISVVGSQLYMYIVLTVYM